MGSESKNQADFDHPRGRKVKIKRILIIRGVGKQKSSGFLTSDPSDDQKRLYFDEKNNLGLIFDLNDSNSELGWMTLHVSTECERLFYDATAYG